MGLVKELFFPLLKRREVYSKTIAGSYYEYHHYKQEIREDCLRRCVYCDIQEEENGGEESMVLDHFRPQKLFNQLKNDPSNLLYSCSGCNSLKRDKWPLTSDNLLEFMTDCGEGFLDPFIHNRQEFFDVSVTGEISGLKAPANYCILVLGLNRETRKKAREIRIRKSEILRQYDEDLNNLRQLLEEEDLSVSAKTHLQNTFNSLLNTRENIVYCLSLSSR